MTLDERKTLTKISTRTTSHNHSPNQRAPQNQRTGKSILHNFKRRRRCSQYAFNISPSSDNCNSPYYIVYGREPVDAELQELEELHKYTGTNCGLKCLWQLSEIWKNHADELRRIRMHRASERDKYAKSLPRYKVGTQVLVRNFTRKPLERKFVSGYHIVRILSDNAYELRKPNGKILR